jgi:ribonuclease P protein component
MRIHVVENSLNVSRAVFVPVRSYPDAVARNRAKRVARECWRLGKAAIAKGHDVAVVLFPGCDEFRERRSQLDRLVRQAGLRP